MAIVQLQSGGGQALVWPMQPLKTDSVNRDEVTVLLMVTVVLNPVLCETTSRMKVTTGFWARTRELGSISKLDLW